MRPDSNRDNQTRLNGYQVENSVVMAVFRGQPTPFNVK